MKDIPLSSGAVLGFQLAGFSDSMKLFNAVFKELVGVPIGQPGAAFDLSTLFQLEASQLKDIVIKVGTSEHVQEAIWKCMMSCTFKGIKDFTATRIAANTFDSEDNRPDFLLVAWEVATLNLAPFFKNLASLSSIQKGIPSGNGQKSEMS